jgi:hypothetical protein
MTPLASFLKEEPQRFGQRPYPFFSTQMLNVEVESHGVQGSPEPYVVQGALRI